MRRFVLPLVLMAAVLLATTGFTSDNVPDVFRGDCFFGKVEDNLGNPVPGVTVRLICPDGSQESDQTDRNGMYRICRPPGGFPPGHYLLTVRCCEKWVSYPGHSSMRVDFVTPCKCK